MSRQPIVVSGGDWRGWAACRGVDPELFFPVESLAPEAVAQVARAKAVCAGCPVREPCLVFALEAIPEGVAGGLTAGERDRLVVASARPERAVRVLELTLGEELAGGSQVELRAAVLGLYQRGAGARRIAARLGMGERRVHRWLARERAGGEL